MKPLAYTQPAQAHDSGLLDQAINWTVRLESGSASAQERAACAAWRATSARHEQAWQKVQAVEATFQNLPRATGHVAYQTLQATSRQTTSTNGRRQALKLLGWGGAAVATGVLAWLHAPGQQHAVFASNVGERRNVTLVDGTRLQLNTGSQARVALSPLRRLVILTQGEILIDTGADTDSVTGKRPFWVETAQVRLQAIGTRFTVRQTDGQTQLHVVEGAVAIHSRSDTAAAVQVIGAGNTFVITAGQAPTRLTDAGLDPTGWADGVLIAKQMRLDALAAELSRYRRMPVRCDEATAGLRVSGVFQLEGSEPTSRALQALASALPVRLVAEPDGAVILVRR